MAYHLPVLASESIDALNIRPDGIYVDTTFGGGGHSSLILNQLGDKGRLISFDQDDDAKANILTDPRFTFVEHNFRFLKRFLRLHEVPQVDGILADLGVSSFQLDQADRGFSYRFDGPLDMRMNQKGSVTAAEVVQTYGEGRLQEIFSRYGEVRNARTLAKHLVQERHKAPIKTMEQFIAVIEPLIRGSRLRYLSTVFQALRIEVNDEMGALEEMLRQALEILKTGGRLVVISYHSIEDRIVKNFLKTGNVKGETEKDFYGNIFRPFSLINKKAIVPSESEIKENSRARSAKMRIAEKRELEQ